jgi:3-deoxy-D-manno-octulosonate 8-phosphate phosphatase (KDO 8-P phosphatase)
VLELSQRFGIAAEEILYIGDDLVDVPVFRHVGLAICPADAVEEVKREADYISPFNGGRGVVREAIEIVLKARGLWESAARGYLYE